MQKLTKTVAMLIMAILTSSTIFVACNHEEEEYTNKSILKKSNKEARLFEQNVPTKDIAYNFMQNIISNRGILQEIHTGIKELVNLGLDENLPVFDILHPENSKLITKSNFKDLQNAFDEKQLYALGLNAVNYYRDLNIYWGYHDNWDGKTIPVICYIDELTTSDYTKGFKFVKGNIEEVTITEKEFDSESYPVIVINFNDYNYEQYPDFKNGSRTKDGVYWVGNSERELKDKEEDRKYNKWTDEHKLYKPYITKFKSGGHQWDTWIKGGSEFKLSASYTGTSMSPIVTTQRLNFTRKQIKNKTEKNTSILIHSDWQEQFLDVVIVLLEEDWGSDKTLKFKLNIKDYGEIDTSIPLLKFDDEVGKLPNITRNSFITSIVNNDPYYYLGDCRIKTEIKVYDKAY